MIIQTKQLIKSIKFSKSVKNISKDYNALIPLETIELFTDDKFLEITPPPPLSHFPSSQWICAYLKLFPSCICTFQEQINDYIYFTVIHGLYNVLVQ